MNASFMIVKIRRFCQGHFGTVRPVVVGIDVPPFTAILVIIKNQPEITPVVEVVDVAGQRAGKW